MPIFACMKKVLRFLLVLVPILLAAPFLYTLLRENRIQSKAQDRVRFTTPYCHFINWRGAEIHYTDEGSGTPVIMIHGFGGSFINWNKLRDRLKKDYRIIRIDLPGFGLSDMPYAAAGKTNFIQQYRDFMSFMLDTLQVDSAYVIGNSMGGMMAWGSAADHPDKVKKLVLIGSAGYDLEKISASVARFMKLPVFEFFFRKGLPLFSSENSARKVYFDPSKINPETVKNNNLLWNREGNIHAAFALASSGQYPDTAIIARVQCPTLILWGRNDKIVPVEHAARFQRDIKNSQLVIFDSCGHCPMIEKPDETADVIRLFFEHNPVSR